MSIMFFAPKIHTLIHIPTSETSQPFMTYVGHAHNLKNTLSLSLRKEDKINKQRIKQMSACDKSSQVSFQVLTVTSYQ